MAIPPITYSGPREGRHHSRKPSLNRRFSGNNQCPPALETPRTLCPKDGDAFSYDPAHLKPWYMPQELWEQLPARLQQPLAKLQHAGAAVLTGFHRLSAVGAETGVIMEEDEDLDISTPNGNFFHNGSLGSPRHNSFFSSGSGSTNYSEPTTPPRTPTSRSGANTPPLPSPISPYTLHPLTHSFLQQQTSAPTVSAVRSSKSTSPASTPHFLPARDPQTSRYLAELAHVRSDCLVRLRHAARRVDTELGETLRNQEFHDTEEESAEDVEKQFEIWWARKKELIQTLEGRGARLVRQWA